MTDRKAFYEYHAALMEPWDGPAAVAFTDGRQIGATLDRNGLRPARYIVTDDDRVIMASEAGVLPVPEEKIVKKWRLQPGKMLLIDLEAGPHRLRRGDQAPSSPPATPTGTGSRNTQLILEDLPPVEPRALRNDVVAARSPAGLRLHARRTPKLLMAPMATTGQEAVGSMGTDTPISAMSDKSKLLYTYFKQNFAQVTNPPIDPIREELVMSLVSFIGPRPNIFDLVGTSRRSGWKCASRSSPMAIWRRSARSAMPRTASTPRRSTSPMRPSRARPACAARSTRLCEPRRGGGARRLQHHHPVRPPGRRRTASPIPALLATAAVHHHLIRKGLRTSVGLVVETGEPREVHHFCCLAGYGAEAINPYLAFETLLDMHAAANSRRRSTTHEVV